jgi:pimeloyl-ACP methyl ester carboxylesterase
VATFVADLERLRVHLGVDHFALAGHSHGGFVALHYALRHPDRVNRLLLMSAQLTGIPSDYAEPSVSRDEPVPAEIADALRYLASVGGLDALFRLNSDAEATEFLARILPLYFRDPRTMSPLLAALNGLSLPCRVLQAVTASDEQYPLSLQEVGALVMPTVLTSGRHDRFVAMGHVQTVARAMRGSTHLVFDESGHFPWLEEPELFFDRSIGALRAERT